MLSRLFFRGSLVALLALFNACGPIIDDDDCDVAPLVLDDQTLDAGTLSQPYDEVIVVTRSGKEHRAIATMAADVSTPLPPGLRLVELDGRFHLSGTPSASGNHTFKVQVQEYGTNCAGRSGEFTVSVTINP